MSSRDTGSHSGARRRFLEANSPPPAFSFAEPSPSHSGLARISTRPSGNYLYPSLAAPSQSPWRGEGATGPSGSYYNSPPPPGASRYPTTRSPPPAYFPGLYCSNLVSSPANYSSPSSQQHRARSPNPPSDRSLPRRRFPSPSPLSLPSPALPMPSGSPRPSSRLQYGGSSSSHTSSARSNRSRASTRLSGAGAAGDDNDPSSNYGSFDANVGRGSGDAGSWRTFLNYGDSAAAARSPVQGRVGEGRARDSRARRYRDNGSQWTYPPY
jgi:hypothetical protein